MKCIRGYIDRMEDGCIVVIAESARQEFIVPYDTHNEFQTGDWVVLTLNKDSVITNIQQANATTQTRKESLRNLKQSLRRR